VSGGKGRCSPLVEHKSFLRRSAGWKEARPVLAKVEHSQGELFPRLNHQPESASRAVDQRRKAGGEHDAAELPPVPFE
jgi:hypothetical protein